MSFRDYKSNVFQHGCVKCPCLQVHLTGVYCMLTALLVHIQYAYKCVLILPAEGAGE